MSRRARLPDVLKEKGFWLLAAAGIAFFHRPLLLGETFFFRDLYLYYLPQRALFADFLRAGEVPLWNPYLHGGMPFLADVSNSAFYPLNLLWLVFSPTTALSLDVAGHVLAAAAAAYLLARVLGAGQPAAFVAGAVHGYCGFTLSQANLLVRLQATPYVPLLILFWHLFLQEGRRRWFLLAVLSGVLQVAAGAPTVIAPCLLTALGWGLAMTTARFQAAARLGLWVLLAAAIAGLAACQLLPMVELAGQSARGEGISYQNFSTWSVDPRRLPELVIPGYLGSVDTLSDDDYWGSKLVDRGFPYMLSLYAGAIAGVLALLGGWSRRLIPSRRLRFYLLALLALSVVFALGRFLPFFELVYDVVPLVRIFRFPVKLLTFGVLPLALLAAFGTEALFSPDSAERRRVRRTVAAAWIVLGVPVLLLLAALAVPAWSEPVQRLLLGQSSARAAAGLAAAAGQALGFWLLATLLLFVLRRARIPVRAWALAAVVLLDLMTAGRGVNPTAPAETVAAVPAAAKLARNVAGDGRLYRGPRPEEFVLDTPTDDVIWLYRWNQEVLAFYLGASYGIPVAFHEDFHGLAPRRQALLTDAVTAFPWEKRRPLLAAAAAQVVITHDELPGMEKAGVIRNASRVPVFVYRNAAAARRLEWVGVWHTVESRQDALKAMLSYGFDPRRHAVLEGPIAARASAGCDGEARIELREARPHRRTYAVTAPCAGVLVFSETFYPGCEVRIDGRRLPVWPANVAFTGAEAEAGEHEVEWRYVPRTLYRGLGISAFTLLALAAVLGRRRLSLRPGFEEAGGRPSVGSS